MNDAPDLARVRAALSGDPAWGAYLLADLEPPLSTHARWFVAPREPAVVLLYDAFGTPLFTLFGPPGACAPLFDQALASARAAAPAAFEAGRAFVACAVDHRSLVERVTPWIDEPSAMYRMRLDAAQFAGAGADDPRVMPLGPGDLPALRALYADGDAADEAPDFFLPAMLDDDTYAGVREGDALVAAAGTHVVARQARAAAIGNVYVRRDRRDRGLGRAVTAAVVRTLLARGTETIVLNVRQDRPAAIRVYERLGFAVHRPFVEGWVSLRDP